MENAFGFGPPEIWNSDQGTQFTVADFLAPRNKPGIAISMDGRGRALDNVFIERLWRSLKYELVYPGDFADGESLFQALEHYFHLYNHRRPHQAPGYRTPADLFPHKLKRKRLAEWSSSVSMPITPKPRCSGRSKRERADFHCAARRHGFCPRDRQLGQQDISLSPAVTRMVAAVGAITRFEEGSQLLGELAGVEVDAKHVERAAEPLGHEIAQDEKQDVKAAAALSPAPSAGSWNGAVAPVPAAIRRALRFAVKRQPALPKGPLTTFRKWLYRRASRTICADLRRISSNDSCE